jgi:ribosomal protein S18 acetylase RimI-like enzyme
MIRRAHIGDVDRIMSIVRSAQLSLRQLGIDQWQDGYPSREVIEGDIEAEVGWVITDDKEYIIGYAAIVLSGEAAYSQIAANEWHTPNDYVVVHRICVDSTLHRRGTATTLMRHAATIARNANIRGFRIDTHRGNTRMLALVERLGFGYCGIITYDSGERLAFDLDLELSNTL